MKSAQGLMTSSRAAIGAAIGHAEDRMVGRMRRRAAAKGPAVRACPYPAG
jgi:hypothetical protein